MNQEKMRRKRAGLLHGVRNNFSCGTDLKMVLKEL
jgi:hypothetical protein